MSNPVVNGPRIGGLPIALRDRQNQVMRAASFVALFLASACTSCSSTAGAPTDPCAGIVPQSLPEPIDLGYVLTSRSPFEDALVGDGNGSILFILPEYPAP